VRKTIYDMSIRIQNAYGKKDNIYIQKQTEERCNKGVCMLYPTDGGVRGIYRRIRRCFLTISSPIDTSKYSILKFIYNKYILRIILLLLLLLLLFIY